MEKLEAIPMDEVSKRLKNLKDYIPGEEEVIYDFGRFLAGRLGSRLNATGLNVKMELALLDLPNSEMKGYPSQIYSILSMRVPEIIEAVCPEDFFEAYKKVYQETH